MSTIKTTMTADAQELLQAQKQVAQGAANVGTAYREAVNESARLSSAATRAFNETRTPLEKYNAKLADLSTLLRKGKIDQDTYNRSVDHASERYQAATQQGSKLSQVMMSLASSAAGFLSVGAAINFVTQALSEANQEAKDAAESLKQGISSRNELAQVLDNMGTADEQIAAFMTRGGAGKNRPLAAQSVFEMQSAGLVGDMDTFLQVGRSGLVAAESMPAVIGAIKSLQVAFGSQEAGKSKAILSKALAAGAVAKGSMQDVVTATSSAGADAASLGLSDEETMAAIAVLSVPLGSVDVGGRHAAALFRELKKGGFKGNLSQALDMMQTRMAGGETVMQILGSENAEASKAANLLLTNRQPLAGLTAGVQAGNTGAALAAKLALLGADPQARTMASAVGIEGAIDVSRSRMGQREALISSLISAEDEMNRLQGMGSVSRFARRTVLQDSYGAIPDVFGIRNNPMFHGSLVSRDQIEEGRATAQATGNQDLLRVLGNIEDVQRQLTDFLKQERSQTRAERDRRSPAPRPTVPAPEN